MSSPYSYISSVDYINDLSFDYIETYSFQRGAAFEEERSLTIKEYQALQLKKEGMLTASERSRLSELNKLPGISYLVDQHGMFHHSAEKTGSFSKDDPVTRRLIEILHTPADDIPGWVCSPLYRDAVVFYNEAGNILSVLNVCLGCRYMETEPFHHIDADYKTYDQLQQFFIEIGHHVTHDE